MKNSTLTRFGAIAALILFASPRFADAARFETPERESERERRRPGMSLCDFGTRPLPGTGRCVPDEDHGWGGGVCPAVDCGMRKRMDRRTCRCEPIERDYHEEIKPAGLMGGLEQGAGLVIQAVADGDADAVSGKLDGLFGGLGGGETKAPVPAGRDSLLGSVIEGFMKEAESDHPCGGRSSRPKLAPSRNTGAAPVLPICSLAGRESRYKRK